ncbi:hypothetical protein [Luteibacter sp.]|uniref:hypothetical protein n=1 Tax=Luteibacter sp. TaxID=1886636 RepID=UPI003F7EC537
MLPPHAGFDLPAVQWTRRRNLLRVIDQLVGEGLGSWPALAHTLCNMRGEELRAATREGRITDALAREIEWAMQRPLGWLDATEHEALER